MKRNTDLSLAVEMVETSKLIPYARNARRHSLDQIEQIGDSISRFGFVSPILVDADNNVISGHGRLMAATTQKLKQVPVIRVSHLSDVERQALVLADNRIAESATWDFELLSAELKELDAAEADLDVLGFDPKDVEKLLVYGEVDLEDIPFTPDESRSGAPTLLMTFSSKKVRLTPEELEGLTETYYAFRKEHGTDRGFVAWLLEAWKC